MSLPNAAPEHKPAPQAGNGVSAPLGSTYQQRFPPHENDDRYIRFAMQAAARELLPQHRIRTCLRAVIPGRDCVEIWRRAESSKAYYLNLVCCGSIWVCPVCAGKISERRRRRLEAALNVTDRIPILEGEKVARVVLARRYYLSMATFTIRHHAGETARDVIARLKAAYRIAWSGRYAQDFKRAYRVIGTIRAVEITHGEHGWHPHIHLLMIHNSANSERVVSDLDIELSLRWVAACDRAGASCELASGVKVSAGDNRASEYISKLGQQVGSATKRWGLTAEITKYVAKQGRRESRTLWDLLADYIGGDVAAGELWIEGVGALKGAKHLEAPNGLWKMLGIDDLTANDQTLAGEDQNALDGLLARLTLEQWRVVLRHSVRGQLLELAEKGGDVDGYIKSLEH